MFHFPLPQDASISGFGMWIGNDLIEADVVEKQRAREIYETILREKRDPGCSNGPAATSSRPASFRSSRSQKSGSKSSTPRCCRCAPIGIAILRAAKRTAAHQTAAGTVADGDGQFGTAAEERDVPDAYGKDRDIGRGQDVSPPSATETERTRRADAQPLAFHSAQVEFAAQEYSPTRDFEVVCEVDGRQSDVVVVPHRRGEDGYFLIQLTPPGTDGNWQREILARR